MKNNKRNVTIWQNGTAQLNKNCTPKFVKTVNPSEKFSRLTFGTR